MRIRFFLGAAALLFAWLTASDALACGLTLRLYYTIRSVAPSDGSTGVPRDAVIVVALDAWDTGEDEYGSLATVSVTRISSGEVVAGSFGGFRGGEHYKYVWRPDAPLAAQEQYRVDVAATLPARADISGPSTMSTTFTTSDELVPPVVLEGELHATLRVGTTLSCLNRNDCGGCIDEVEVPALYADVELPRVTGGFADHGYGAWLLVTDGPRIFVPGEPHDDALGQVDLFEPALPERTTIRIPEQGGAFVPCLLLTAFDSARHYDSASLCLDEVDVEALLGTVNDDAGPDNKDAGPASADAGSQSARSNALSPDTSHADADQDSGCRVASGPTSAGYSTLLLALIALLATRARRFVAWSTRRCNPPRVPRNYFDEDVAARYDETSGSMFEPEVLGPTVELLAELAGDGAALEFAVGTGRVALPLAARGVPVSGIELSAAMAEQLRAKDEAERIKVAIGDMATTRVDGSFRLVYLVFNTIGNLTTQDQQVACFANAAAHLEPGGFFVIEMGVPDLRRLPPGEDARVFSHAPGYVGYDRYIDFGAQQAMSHHFVADGSGVREFRTPFRYVWPSELDLMAKLAGMSLHDRWAGWDRSPFTGESASHVSVWQKTGD